jgi:uncharacterized protein (DUF39 family)
MCRLRQIFHEAMCGVAVVLVEWFGPSSHVVKAVQLDTLVAMQEYARVDEYMSCSLIVSQDHLNWMHFKMCLLRTYFLCHIVNGEERRYNVDSSVTSCLKVFATAFAVHHEQIT